MVYALGFRVLGSGFGVQCSGLRFCGFGCRFQGSRITVWGLRLTLKSVRFQAKRTDLKGFDDFYKKVKARIWPGMSCMCHVRSTAGGVGVGGVGYVAGCRV